MKDHRIIFRHILPNALAPVFVTATLDVATAILVEAGLSFLGFGVQPPAPSWGNILTEGRTYIFDAWWLTVFPGLASSSRFSRSTLWEKACGMPWIRD